MTQWLKYFLTGMSDTAETAVSTLSEGIALKNQLETHVNQTFGRKSHSAVILLNQLFHNPVITIQRVIDVCKLSFKSSNNLVTDFANTGILKEMTGQSRNRIFVFEQYLDLFTKEK